MATIGGNSPQLRFAQKWIDAHLARDHKIDTLFSKGYKHQTLPESLGLPEETREEYMKRYEGIVQAVTEMGSKVHEVIEVPGKVVIHATGTCATVHGITLASCGSIYILTLVEEDGELKVSHCKEFLDSQEYGSFAAKLTEAANMGAPAL